MINEIMKLQAEFDARVVEEKGLIDPHISERILALLVEIGEMTNEWRRFKFWSNDQEPRTKSVCEDCGGDGVTGLYDDLDCKCETVTNPLLEEYVDGLHFVCSIGNALYINQSQVYIPVGNNGAEDDYKSVLHHIHSLYAMISQYGVRMELPLYSWEAIMSEYLNLGTMLGFTLDQIHIAYLDKNKINHERQSSGY